MQDTKIKNLRLKKMSVNVQSETLHVDVELLKAHLKVNYDFNDDIKNIFYDIEVHHHHTQLFTMQCTYSFETIDSFGQEKDLLDYIVNLLQPRIEEILSLITMESDLVK